jgi:hypothetical protein
MPSLEGIVASHKRGAHIKVIKVKLITKTLLGLTLMWICCLVSYAVNARQSSLSATQVTLLVDNVPLAISVAQAGGCPTADYSKAEMGSSLPIVQFRDMCPSSELGCLLIT